MTLTSDIHGFDEVFQSQYLTPFAGLSTFHQQLQYYKTHLHLVEPTRITLNCTHIQRIAGRKRKTIVKKEEVFYISILQTLEVMLQNDAVLKEVLQGHQSSTETLTDYCDGNIFKEHSLYSVDPSALQIIFYFDDLELCNPLGSKRTIHKVGAFYFMLGNLSPNFRSRVSSIQLVALAKSSIINTHGMDKILAPFIRDMEKLESGVTMDIKGQEHFFKGTLTVVSADNPASQLLGGFKQGHTAFLLCTVQRINCAIKECRRA